MFKFWRIEMEFLSVVFLIIGVAVGFVIAWLLLNNNFIKKLQDGKDSQLKEISELKVELATSNERNNEIEKLNTRIKHYETEIKEHTERIRVLSSELSSKVKELEEERKQNEERLSIYRDAEEKMKDVFKSLSTTALQSNNENFLQNAKALFEQYNTNFESNFDNRKKEIENFVNPLKETLTSFDGFVKEIEKDRAKGYGELKEQIQSMKESQAQLQSETRNLVTALRKPQVRGRWGEIQLRRVVEMAGMLPYCDFTEQTTYTTDDGKIRPDMIIRLPNERQIAVDSKVTLDAYLNAIEADKPEDKDMFLVSHARQLRDHITKLSGKNYQSSIGQTPEFTVCFVPGEIYFYAALEKDPTLIEFGVQSNVIIASPTTLISLLKAVAYGWKQEQMTKNAYEISELAKELYGRITTFAEHLSKLGQSLDNATKKYNEAVGSLEHRVLPQARKFNELGAGKNGEIPELIEIETSIRELRLD
jgi:DNA recombination protein RmuC